MSSFLTDLRIANLVRNEEWQNKAKPFSLVFRANELSGEVGETCNILKKFDREMNYKVRGSRDTIDHLGEELADIIICSDLLGMDANITYGVDEWPDVEAGGPHDYSLYGASMAALAGRACGVAINYTSEFNHRQLTAIMRSLVYNTKTFASRLGIDLEQHTRMKFNVTSFKMGLKTEL